MVRLVLGLAYCVVVHESGADECEGKEYTEGYHPVTNAVQMLIGLFYLLIELVHIAFIFNAPGFSRVGM